MAKTLDALLHLQSVELQLVQVRRRLKTRQNAVLVQERRIAEIREKRERFHENSIERRKEADRLELELRGHEERVAKLREALNAAKTNKEYATLLTEINTLKADNARVEGKALEILQEVDTINAEVGKVQEEVKAQEQRLEHVRQSTSEEITRLQTMADDLSARRREAADAVPAEPLAVFDRIVGNYEGQAMAKIEIHGKKPPYNYVCGGCFMSLSAEHANALRSRDEIRRCDNCGRILYLERQAEQSHTT